MTLERELAEQQEAIERLQETVEAIQRVGSSKIQTRRVASTKPTDKQVYMWDESAGKLVPTTGAQILLARATSGLTLTTSAQSIVGDGDSTKVRLLLPTIGDWLIEATCDFVQSATDVGDMYGELFVNDSGTPKSGVALLHVENVERATVPQRWKVTTTAANTPVELKARKQNAGGTGAVNATHTTLTAAIGIGGGSAGGGSGSMTTVKEDGTQVGGADIQILDFLGADFDITESPDKEINIVIAAAIARDAEVTADIATHAAIAAAHHAKYLDSAAIAAVEGEATLDLTGDVTIAGFTGLAEIATPANPAQNKLRLFARANGTDIELISLSSTGAECVICTLANGAAPANVLTLNWIE